MPIDPLVKRWTLILYPLMILAVVLWRVLSPLGMIGARFVTSGQLALMVLLSPLLLGRVFKAVSDVMLSIRMKRARRGGVWTTARIVKKVVVLDCIKLTLATMHKGETEQEHLVITLANLRLNGGTTPGFLVNLYLDEKESTVFLVEPTGELAPGAYRAAPARDENLTGPETALYEPTLGRQIEHLGWFERTFWY